ncbi:MAG: YitT family protein [Eubacteriaceae bacterium]|nr:YitT family protein [Eubacteriaceae bacterium]
MKAKSILKIFLDMLLLAAGSFIAAFAIEEFLAPCLILDGGVVGISMILSTLYHWQLGIVTIVLNVPFLLIGARKLGKQFLFHSLWAMIMFSIGLRLFEGMTDATHQYLLAVCYGGVILGLGVGIVIRRGGCLDGTEVVALMLNRRFNLPVGTVVLVFNVIIYACAGLLFGLDRAMYSLLTYFITSRILDVMESLMEQAKAAIIITNDSETIADQIYKKLGRTVTRLEAQGLISGKKDMLYCVLTRFEVQELKSIIKDIDSSAFITISDVSEIIGNHIKSNEGRNSAASAENAD